MIKKVLISLFCATWILSATAQNTIESIRKEYNDVHVWISHMMPNEEGETGMPPEYYELNVIQNLPGTGPHREVVRMFYGEEEAAEDVIYPPHYLRFATAKYNFAAREFYEEYLYDEKGRVMFIYAITPDADPNMTPYELRMWFDGKRLLRFTAKKYDGPKGYLDIASLRKGTFKEVYSGTDIPEMYQLEANRCKDRALRFLEMFKGIDKNTYL
jgi:hypothetical protein